MNISPVYQAVANSVYKTNPSGLHNGLRLTWYWALLLCLFVLATKPYPDLGAKLAQLLFIWLQTTWQHNCLTARSLSAFLSPFSNEMLIISNWWISCMKQQGYAVVWCTVVCTLCSSAEKETLSSTDRSEKWDEGHWVYKGAWKRQQGKEGGV